MHASLWWFVINYTVPVLLALRVIKPEQQLLSLRRRRNNGAGWFDVSKTTCARHTYAGERRSQLSRVERVQTADGAVRPVNDSLCLRSVAWLYSTSPEALGLRLAALQ